MVAFFDPQDDLGLLFEPEPEPTPSPEEIRDTEESAEAAAAAAELSKEAALKKLEKLNERGVVPQDVIDEIENEDDFSINLSSDGDDSDFFGDCENAKL